MNLNELKNAASVLKSGKRMPALFIGHGTPMNGIETNSFSNSWRDLAKTLPRPEAIVCISAHWLTQGVRVTAMKEPRTIHDFGGFPEELFAVRYPAPGSPAMAENVRKTVASVPVTADTDWGLDHGTWTVIRHMYPEADIPVLQVSIDYHQPPRFHYELGRELAALRDKGVLVVGSGNMVHNLRKVAFDRIAEVGYGYDWAHEMNAVFKKHILAGNHAPLIDYPSMGEAAMLAIPTPDHYYPMLYVLGMQAKGEEAALFNDQAVGGSLTMTSILLG